MLYHRLDCRITSIDDDDVLCLAFGVETIPELALLLGRDPLLLRLLSLRTTMGAMNSPLNMPALLRCCMLDVMGVRGVNRLFSP